MFCAKCGKQLPDHALFCDGCGAKVITPSVPTTAAAEVQPGEPSAKGGFRKNKFNTFAVVLTAVLAIVLILLIVVKAAGKKTDIKKADLDYSISLEANKSIKDTKQYLSAQSWQEMAFLLDGVEYQLPLEISKLEKNGWSLDFEDEKVEPGQCVRFSAYHEQNFIRGTLCNFGSSKTDARNCKVRCIRFVWANGVFPNDISILSSGIDEAYVAYGDPDYYDESGNFYVWGDQSGYLDGKGKYIRLFCDEEEIISYAEMACEIN